MKILLDENLPESLVDKLTDLGHEVDSVNTLDIKGIANGELYRSVGNEYDLLLTKDRGFANNIRQQDGQQDTKLILVTIPQKPAEQFVNDFIEHFTDTDWSNYENGEPWPDPEIKE